MPRGVPVASTRPCASCQKPVSETRGHWPLGPDTPMVCGHCCPMCRAVVILPSPHKKTA